MFDHLKNPRDVGAVVCAGGRAGTGGAGCGRVNGAGVAGVIVGGGGAGGGDGSASTRAPQFPQKRAPSSNAVPHSPQNLAIGPSGLHDVFDGRAALLHPP
jgi:hypothetical protein